MAALDYNYIADLVIEPNQATATLSPSCTPPLTKDNIIFPIGF